MDFREDERSGEKSLANLTLISKVKPDVRDGVCSPNFLNTFFCIRTNISILRVLTLL
jgi:hypothetical protein